MENLKLNRVPGYDLHSLMAIFPFKLDWTLAGQRIIEVWPLCKLETTFPSPKLDGSLAQKILKLCKLIPYSFFLDT